MFRPIMQSRSVTEPEMEQVKFDFKVLLYLHFPADIHFLSKWLMWITGNSNSLNCAEILLQVEAK